MSNIILIGGEKGGQGKSLTAMITIEYLMKRGIKYKLFDTDRTNPDVGKIYAPEIYDKIMVAMPEDDNGLKADRANSVQQIYFSEDEEEIYLADEIFNQACQGQGCQIIVNLPSQVEILVHRWLKKQDILSLAREENISIMYWFVTDGSPESIELLKQNIQRYQEENILWILVKNHGLNKRINEDISKYLNPKELAEIVGIIELPKLNIDKKDIDRIKSDKIKLGESADREKRQEFPILTKQRIKNFLEKCFIQIDNLDIFSEKSENYL